MSGGPAVAAGQRAQAVTYNQNVRGIWQPLTLQNGWTNFGAGYVTAQYRLIDTVTCEVIGLVTAGTVTDGTPVFTLPAGYYNPNNQQGIIMFDWTGSGAGVAWLQVRTNGQCQIQSAPSSSYYFHEEISLDA